MHEFFDQDVPPYAIVSHRWSKEEVSYQEFLQIRTNLSIEQCAGYGWTKIAKACEIANLQNLEWVWIDTICTKAPVMFGMLKLGSIFL